MEYENQNIVNVDLNKEMKKSYIDYAMSVIVSRALPDVRDGLKPVHRRIIYTMYESGLTPDKPYRKCATTVGDVLGKYHPHGDAAVYDSLVRMAQDFSLRYPLVDGHGNFGSVDGDPPAAYRYTEARMQKLSLEMVKDIEKNTVDFVPNYDEHCEEPSVLPSKVPQLLINGSSGIAVGMATNIPPHNLGETIDAVCALIDNPELSIDELMEYIKGPDFPTGAIIMGRSGIRAAYHTGRGKIIMRARAEIEEEANGRQKIIVTEIPYQVNKARLVEKIAECVKDKRIEGISDLRDESDRAGMRIVIELKRDAIGSVVLNHLYKNTQMQETFGIIMLALVDNKPKILNLKEILEEYIRHQENVITRRTKFELEKAENRVHILEGLKIATDNIDEVISIIRSSYDDPKERLMARFELSEIQAKAILDMRLIRLSGLEREKVEAEINELNIKIAELKGILADEKKILGIIKDELTEIKEKYNDDRRSEIANVIDEIDDEDLIADEENVVTLTHFGYVKRLASDTYRSQRRGGKGVSALATREEDFVENLIVCRTHDYVLFFTNLGRMYRLKAYQLPEAGRQAKGSAIVNLLQLMPNEKVTTIIPVTEFSENQFLTMITKEGVIKKTPLTDYDTNRKGGLYAISLNEEDELINVKLTNGDNQVFVVTHDGKSIRFKETDVRPMGRTAHGVRAIDLSDGDYVVGSAILDGDAELLLVTENGLGKVTASDEYKIQSRAGKGVKTYKITEKTGKLVGVKAVGENDDVMLITSGGTIIRTAVSGISRMGRATQGVMLMRLAEDEKIVSIAQAQHEDEEEENTENNGAETSATPEEN